MPLNEVSEIFRPGVVTGYREGMLNLFNLFSLERLAHLSQFHIVLFYVLLFHVLHFHVLSFVPSFSRPAISCPAHWSFNFMSCYFMLCKLVRQCPSFSRPAFSAPPTDVLAYSEFSSVICRLSILALAVLVDLFRRRILAEPGHKVDTCLHALPTVAICV